MNPRFSSRSVPFSVPLEEWNHSAWIVHFEFELDFFVAVRMLRTRRRAEGDRALRICIYVLLSLPNYHRRRGLGNVEDAGSIGVFQGAE